MKWIECSNKLPESGVPVLIFNENKHGNPDWKFHSSIEVAIQVKDGRQKSLGYRWFSGRGNELSASHWMPLPESPQL